MRTLPGHLHTLYTRQQIDERLRALASDLDRRAQSALAATGAPLLTLCVLRGGVFFFSDLVQTMTQSVEPAFCRASSYARGANASQGNALNFSLEGVDVKGRAVVIVDNICDSGRTFRVAQAECLAKGAHSVITLSLIHRLRPDSEHTPTLSGFVYDKPDWLAGYGMRDKGAFMNFPEVYRVATP